jgi:hypothetical protein
MLRSMQVGIDWRARLLRHHKEVDSGFEPSLSCSLTRHKRALSSFLVTDACGALVDDDKVKEIYNLDVDTIRASPRRLYSVQYSPV